MKLPDKIFERHIAILGKTGAGKTFAAKGFAEHLLTSRQRVCVIDPTDGWWGLRSDATGKKPAFPVVVFGGEHADAPLSHAHGAALAEIIGTTDTPAVLSTRLMTVGERTRFFTDFAEALLRKNKGPLHVIIDEAHLFMPQGRVADPQSGKMLHAGNNLVSLGRGIGLRIILLTQRPAKLHKDSLTQAETLIAMRLIAPQDRGAVEDWIGEWADQKQGREIIQSLPSLPTGEGWVWSPEINLLECVKFPRIATYDSSRAPDGDTANVVLAKIDLPTIQSRLEAVAADAFQNDPARLRQRIAELERASKAPVAQAPAPEPKIIEKPVLSEIQLHKLEVVQNEICSDLEALGNHLGALRDSSLVIAEALKALRVAPPLMVPRLIGSRDPKPLPVISRPAQPVAKHQVQVNTAAHNGDMGRVEQKVLDALAELLVLGVARPPRSFVAMMSGYTNPKSGGFTEACGRLRGTGHVDYPDGDTITATDSGLRHANKPTAPSSSRDLQEHIIRMIGGTEAKILRQLIDCYPASMERASLGQAVGYGNPKSGGFTEAMGRLRGLGFVDYPNGQEIVALPTLFIGE